ncbi:kinase-like protein, partial [Marasmius fiardii PR-910]
LLTSLQANVLVDEQGHCYLADFGLAAALKTTTLLSLSRDSGKGTTRWMAPELLIGLSSKSPASDIYAYACTVYEIIAGEPPFAHVQSDAEVSLLVYLSGAKPECPASVEWCPNNIWTLLQYCWERETDHRPTAADVHAFLVHLQQLHRRGQSWKKEEFPRSRSMKNK